MHGNRDAWPDGTRPLRSRVVSRRAIDAPPPPAATRHRHAGVGPTHVEAVPFPGERVGLGANAHCVWPVPVVLHRPLPARSPWPNDPDPLCALAATVASRTSGPGGPPPLPPGPWRRAVPKGWDDGHPWADEVVYEDAAAEEYFAERLGAAVMLPGGQALDPLNPALSAPVVHSHHRRRPAPPPPRPPMPCCDDDPPPAPGLLRQEIGPGLRVVVGGERVRAPPPPRDYFEYFKTR